MKASFIFSAFVASLFTLSATATDYKTKTVPVSEFDFVECNIPCDLIYTQGDASFEITSSLEVVDHIVASVKNRKLSITVDKNKLYKFGNTKVRISCKTLRGVELSGAIEFKAEEGFETDEFTATLNGASEMDVDGMVAGNASVTANGAADIEMKNIKCDKLSVSVNGAGSCELEGYAAKADLVVNGVGSINAKGLKSDAMNSAVNGIGSIKRN